MSIVPSRVWLAKSSRGQASDHFKPSLARGVDLQCPMLWVSGLVELYINMMVEENSNPKQKIQPLTLSAVVGPALSHIP